MNCRSESKAYVDEAGRLVIPAEVRFEYGLKPGSQIRIEKKADGLSLRTPVTHLRKVYIEPTNRCNLECRTCIRNVWDEPLGQMNSTTFDRIVEGLRSFSPPPTIFFGGFGEPLAHPDIVEMVVKAKFLGSQVELITNGTMLTPEISRGLIKADLDMLWVSIDGATPESYADVRLGAALPEVLANLKHFRDIRMEKHLLTPEIGIVFVAMKRNITDLPSVLKIGSQLDVMRFLVTNVLPYNEELKGEILYSQAMMDILYQPPLQVPHVKLPKIDVYQIARDELYWALRHGGQSISIGGAILGESSDRCPFIENAVTAINWEGNLSPCLPLMHSYVSFLDDRRRASRRYVIGNINEQSLCDLWNTLEYVELRERVQAFTFSHCIFCAGCELSWANEKDCRGNAFPTCGGCLWAQGVIQCP
jgi:AbrB family looped-hinge helix DNA binding protein